MTVTIHCVWITKQVAPERHFKSLSELHDAFSLLVVPVIGIERSESFVCSVLFNALYDRVGRVAIS